ncbi:MAG: hypothetical protein QOH50_709 [Kribbellaceae bacterium]|jgi:hypothetical protein|nr:hypothetical protein [Kribbellaceae bacterium]
MCRSSSDEQSRAIDKLPEDIMLFHTTQSAMAEVAYRQERLRRDFQRPGWFQRKPARHTPEPCLPMVRARHAM